VANETTVKTGQANIILLLLVGLLVGFIGGYVVGNQGAPAGAGSFDLGNPATTCPHELDPGDRHILAGFVCPAPECADQILDCHCATAHQIKDQVKQLLAEGRSPEEIRTQIQAQYKL